MINNINNSFSKINFNLVANYGGQLTSILLNLMFIPIYISYIGIEAYGLIGVFGILQAWLGLLDGGLSPAICRQVAKEKYNNTKTIHDIIYTVEIIAVVIAFIITIIIFLSSNWLSNNWINSNKLNKNEIEICICLMGLIASLKYVENIYQSSMMGLQSHLKLNITICIFNILKGFGAILILKYINASVTNFFLWQTIISFFSLITLRYINRRELKYSKIKPTFSINKLKVIWKFASGMLLLSFATLILTQIDKILIAKLLPLEELGKYSIAVILGNCINYIIGPIISTYYPKLCQYSDYNEKLFIYTFHKLSQLVTIASSSVVLVIVFNPETIIYLWTRDKIMAKEVSFVLQILLISNIFYSFHLSAYNAQLAKGWTKISIVMVLVSIPFVVSSMLIFIPKYGIVASAVVYLMMHALIYVSIFPQFMFKKILINQGIKWYINDLLIPFVSMLSAMVLMYITIPDSDNFYIILIKIIIEVLILLLVGILSSNIIKKELLMLRNKAVIL